ncbi:lipoprotein, partial [Vibrio metoecus]
MKWVLAFWLVATNCFSASLYANDGVLEQAYQSQQSDLQVQGFGQVVKVLPDDNDGSKHQKFILKLNSGQTLLVAHNIDLAPRIPNLQVGDSVEFYGEYEWNKKGG